MFLLSTAAMFLFIYWSSIISQILDLIYWMVTIFGVDQMTSENREYYSISFQLWHIHSRDQSHVSENIWWIVPNKRIFPSLAICLESGQFVTSPSSAPPVSEFDAR